MESSCSLKISRNPDSQLKNYLNRQAVGVICVVFLSSHEISFVSLMITLYLKYVDIIKKFDKINFSPFGAKNILCSHLLEALSEIIN